MCRCVDIVEVLLRGVEMLSGIVLGMCRYCRANIVELLETYHSAYMVVL